MRRAAIAVLSALLIVGMSPLYSMTLFGDGNAYAYTPSASGQNAYADGSTWTASGTAGLNSFKKIYGNGIHMMACEIDSNCPADLGSHTVSGCIPASGMIDLT